MKKIPLLDIDLQGALKFQKVFPQSNFFAILPPSIDALNLRLVKRGSETSEKIEVRLKNAEWEIPGLLDDKFIFNYRIVNQDLDLSKKTIEILIATLYSKELTGNSVAKQVII